jgi:hypothetical protein
MYAHLKIGPPGGAEERHRREEHLRIAASPSAPFDQRFATTTQARSRVVRFAVGWASVLGEGKMVGKKSTHFIIEVRGADLVVSLLNGKFKATYYKPTGRPNLILRERTKTDDEALVSEALQAAVAKARELGWIS